MCLLNEFGVLISGLPTRLVSRTTVRSGDLLVADEVIHFAETPNSPSLFRATRRDSGCIRASQGSMMRSFLRARAR